VIFRNRTDAGKYLATKLSKYAGREDVIVLALPRGGVPVAFEVAQTLNAPLDVFLVRKLGVPGHEELAMGAIASGGVLVRNESVLSYLNIPENVLSGVTAKEQKELERRERAYRGNRPAPDLKGQIAILIDDGLATGSTMRAAAAAGRQQQPARIVVAVPVAARESCAELRDEVDEIVCGATPKPFGGVGMWYADFSQTTDEEVRELLEKASLQLNYAS
jgi:putative phosphoribosyl transferase